jgi:hypothetical protein
LICADGLRLIFRWRTAGNAANQVLENVHEDPCGVQDLAVLVKTLSAACKLASDHPNALAASQAIREGLAMHEIALTFALLSSEAEISFAAADAFFQRAADLEQLVDSFAGNASSSAHLELRDAQSTWRADVQQLFPTGRGQSNPWGLKSYRRPWELIDRSSVLSVADYYIDPSLLHRVLSARPATTRAHAYAVKSLYERWDMLIGPIKSGAILPHLPEFTEWLHLGSTLLCLGQSCFSIHEQRDKQYHPNLDTVNLIQERKLCIPSAYELLGRNALTDRLHLALSQPSPPGSE